MLWLRLLLPLRVAPAIVFGYHQYLSSGPVPLALLIHQSVLQNLSEAERERRSLTRLYAEDQQAPFPPAPEQTAYAGPLLDQWVQGTDLITVS